MTLLCFTLVFLYSINNIYLANIIYIGTLLKDILMNNKILIKKNKIPIFFFILFMIWVTISTFFYNIENQNIDSRGIIQYLFTLQYFILIITIKIKEDKFELWIYRFVILNSLFILGLFLFLYCTSSKTLVDNSWATNYIPGWPNSPPIPLLIGLWLSFKNSKGTISKILIYSSIFCTGSRGAILAGAIIIGYYLVKNSKYKKNYLIISFIISFILIIISILGVGYLKASDAFLIRKMMITWDRIDIFNTTMQYLQFRPVLGYGGNTIGQIFDLGLEVNSAKNWGHTHNWILEIMLRYGTVGVLLFSCYMLSIWFSIKNKEKKFMFLLLLILALFQIYIRDFVFLFYMSYLSAESTGDNESTNESYLPQAASKSVKM